MIVLENKAYNASWTPLEGTQGQYLSKLPAQGALLTNYYGTGHSSLDNYLSMVSGQAPVTDTESDCPAYTQDERRLRQPARDGELRPVRVGCGRQRARR